MLRFLRFIKSLRLLVDCLVKSMLNLLWCIVLIGFILSFFSLFFVQSIIAHAGRQEHGEEIPQRLVKDFKDSFGSFQLGMLSLFKACTGGAEWSLYYEMMLETGWVNATVYLFFVCFFYFVLFNVMTSIFVEKIIGLAQPDIEDRLVERQAANRKFAADFYNLCKDVVQEDSNGYITYKQFDCLLHSNNVRDVLAVHGVGIHETKHFFDMMSETKGADESTVSLEMLAAVLMRSKGMATSVDLLTLRYQTKNWVMEMLRSQQDFQDSLKAQFTNVLMDSSQCYVDKRRSRGDAPANGQEQPHGPDGKAVSSFPLVINL